MKPLRIDQDDVKKAIQSGHSYIQVGKRKYLLMEVEEVSHDDGYQVTDPDEEKQLLKALEGDNPILSADEIKRMLES
jgi:hypothetical protein